MKTNIFYNNNCVEGMKILPANSIEVLKPGAFAFIMSGPRLKG